MEFNNLFLMIAVAFCFGLFGFALGKHTIEQQAVVRGFAIHCPLDGEFGWLDECEEKIDIRR